MRERRFELLYGPELKTLIEEKPLAWVPLGILERHGEHLPWGLDGSKAHGVCLYMAGKLGGVVLPCNHFAGVHEAWDDDPRRARAMQAEIGDFYLRPETFEMFLYDLLAGLTLIGFSTTVLYSGHYPTLQRHILTQVAQDASEQLNTRIIAFTEIDVFGEGDHAGKYETSLYLALGGKVRFAEMHEDQRGQWGQWQGETPMNASKEFGMQCLERMVLHFADII